MFNYQFMLLNFWRPYTFHIQTVHQTNHKECWCFSALRSKPPQFGIPSPMKDIFVCHEDVFHTCLENRWDDYHVPWSRSNRPNDFLNIIWEIFFWCVEICHLDCMVYRWLSVYRICSSWARATDRYFWGDIIRWKKSGDVVSLFVNQMFFVNQHEKHGQWIWKPASDDITSIKIQVCFSRHQKKSFHMQFYSERCDSNITQSTLMSIINIR